MAGEERRPVFHAVLQAERQIINRRRKSLNRKELHSDPPPVDAQQCIGLALSGGGIRSSTFSLGVLQGLARKQLLQRFDYLSTVSGGGYVGCYFTSLFIPKTLRQGSPAAVAPESFSAACDAAYQAILGSSATQNAAQAHADVRSAAKPGAARGRDPGERAADSGEWSGAASLNWLRENGRYLTPGGAGDLLFAIGMQVRNWFAIQYVVGMAILFCLLSFATTRAWMIARWPLWRRIEAGFLPGPSDVIYWSPGWMLVAAMAMCFVLPPAIAYWFVHARDTNGSRLSWAPLWHEIAALFSVLVALTWAYAVLEVRGLAGSPGDFAELPAAFWAAAMYVLVAVLTMVCFFVGVYAEMRSQAEQNIEDGKSTDDVVVNLRGLRTRFTQYLRWTLQGFLIAAGLATLGTIGQTLYAYLYPQQGSFSTHLVHLLAAVATFTAGLVAGVRQLYKLIGSKKSSKHPMVPLGLLAGGSAVVLLLLTGSMWALLVQAALWAGGPPPALPPEFKGVVDWSRINDLIVSVWGLPGTGSALPLSSSGGVTLLANEAVRVMPGWITLTWAGACALFVTTGYFLNFLNMSSLHQLYAARLTRAYLGATNRKRFEQQLPVTKPMNSDSISAEVYYHRDLAAPVHLINVTVNRTRPAKTQLVQRQRKGLPMTFGPGYMVLNGIVLERDDTKATLTLRSASPVMLFGKEQPADNVFHFEQLGIGDWCAISGAAFSTGLGIQTSLGLSLLAGLANVRLGYWWDANLDQAEGALNRTFAAYRYLWGELMADFKGPELPFWFLTDGGHFENTGVYELIRRRVGIIVTCDNGCDPDYGFDDLGNLARKIRIDFGAEMREVSANDLQQLKTAEMSDTGYSFFGCARDFAAPESRKSKCALLYVITYDSDDQHATSGHSLLIVLKPSMIADAPIDVAQYAGAHPDFPNQTTLDQFFDDAQWESYRMLGDTIATTALSTEALDFDGWYRALQPQAAAREEQPNAPRAEAGEG